MIRAWAAKGPRQKLEPYEYDPGPLGAEEVEIAVESCGICHSDLSIINNDWGISTYPAIPGHEVIGRVIDLGPQAKGLTIGQAVGVGWGAASCMHYHQCLSGDQNLCAQNVPTIVGHYGGFAERLRAQWPWAIPLSNGLDVANAGPLLCGGTTVFTPLSVFDVKPTDRVGVVGIAGLATWRLNSPMLGVAKLPLSLRPTVRPTRRSRSALTTLSTVEVRVTSARLPVRLISCS
jgi:alcohol/geraniol dehydrogenase (NADP+)